jgi:tetratricopeptide (TPR) repeat protein
MFGEEAVALATELRLDHVRAHALNTLGTARVNSGDRGGLDQLQESLRIALELNSVPDILRGYNNLSHCFGLLGETARSSDFQLQGINAADRFGERGVSRSLRANRPRHYLDTGDWNQAARLAGDFIAEVEGGLPSGHAQASLFTRAYVRWGSDDVDGALADVERALEIGRAHGSPDHLAPELALLAYILVQTGEERRAHEAADELLEPAGEKKLSFLVERHETVLVFNDLGRLDQLNPILESGASSPGNGAARLAAAGQLVEAADIYAGVGNQLAEAELRLRAGRQLAEAGRRKEADVQLQKSLAFWRRAGAKRYTSEGEALLAAMA